MIRTPNVRQGRVSLESVRYVQRDVYEKWVRRGLPEEGDLILTREAPLGEVGRLRDAAGVFLGQRLVLYRPDPEEVDPDFLLAAMLGASVQAQIRALGSGSTVEHMRVPDCGELLIDCPPLGTQRRIGSILAALDALIEINERRIELLEELARSLYRDWFMNLRFPGHESVSVIESASGMAPEGWPSGRFTDLADVLSGGTPKTAVDEFWGGGIPFFTPRDTPQGSVALSTERTLTPAGVDACASQLFPSRTVFITARGTVGKVALAGRPMAVNQSCYALRGKPGVGQHFVLEMARSCAAKLRAEAHGAVFDTITMETLARFRVPLPPQPVLDAFEDVVGPLYDFNTHCCNTVANLRAIRDLLLSRLVTGQLDISDIDLGVLTPAEPE